MYLLHVHIRSLLSNYVKYPFYQIYLVVDWHVFSALIEVIFIFQWCACDPSSTKENIFIETFFKRLCNVLLTLANFTIRLTLMDSQSCHSMRHGSTEVCCFWSQVVAPGGHK